jgi:exodeoxyribonuclease VII large subunit
MQALNGAIDEERIYSVSEITSLIKDLIESEFPDVWIVGEVSNCTVHSSGHVYFTLKDDGAQIRCVLFSRSARRAKVSPENGLKIQARGRLTVYEKQGQYELIVTAVVPLGRGDLYAAFNELKERLAKEGLFDPERKKPLPAFPSRIAVVTSPTGAAVRDVIMVATKIHAGVDLVVVPVKVQGVGAREEIAEAIAYLNAVGGFEVIVLARGGGSIEDLWAFNEEIVARAIAGSGIPVVSAVGHEIDFTIADFAADARAATPSAAPPLVLRDYIDVKTKLQGLTRHAAAALSARLERHKGFLAGLGSLYALRRVKDRLVESMRDIDEKVLRARHALTTQVESNLASLSSLTGKVQTLSPLATLARGYSICFKDDTGSIVRSYKQVRAGDRVRMRFAEGGAVSDIVRSEKESV